MKYFLLTVLAFVTLAQGEKGWSKIEPVKLPHAVAPLPRIVGGKEAEPHSIPFHVAVEAGGTFCSGSIIRPNVVITSASCVYGAKSVKVTAGAHNIQKEEETQQVITSSKIIIHERYDTYYFKNNIALIILPTDIKLDHTAAVVPVIRSISPFLDEEVTISGWGKVSDANGSVKSPVLRYAIEYITNHPFCVDHYGNYYVDYYTNVCVRGSKGKGPCSGDSGGPLTIVRDGQVFLAGIMSFRHGSGCQYGYPSVYTKAHYYATWIDKNIP